MHESEHPELEKRFAVKENWSRADSVWNRVKARAGNLPMVVLRVLAFCALPSASRAQVPVYDVTPKESTIRFDVGSSVPIKGTFDKWSATMKFSPMDVRSGVLDIEIQADSVNSGSSLKNNKLKSKDFFDVKDFPIISFKSTKVIQTGPNTFDLEGDFTIRGVTKTEKLTFTDNGKGSISGSIDGSMVFNRKDYGMNGDIPFIKIANRVEVNVCLKWKRVSGAPPFFNSNSRFDKTASALTSVSKSPEELKKWVAGDADNWKETPNFAKSIKRRARRLI